MTLRIKQPRWFFVIWNSAVKLQTGTKGFLKSPKKKHYESHHYHNHTPRSLCLKAGTSSDNSSFGPLEGLEKGTSLWLQFTVHFLAAFMWVLSFECLDCGRGVAISWYDLCWGKGAGGHRIFCVLHENKQLLRWIKHQISQIWHIQNHFENCDVHS